MLTFQIREIHQIEITSRCNLRCKYCTHPIMTRPKIDMDWNTYREAVAAVKYCRDHFGQKDVNLAGIGESTMHPDFVEYVAHAREQLGAAFKLVLATNGLLVTPALAQALLPYRPTIFVSMHRPERAKLAVDALRDVGLLAGVSHDPAEASTDWAGQIKNWRVTAAKGRKCPWVLSGWCVVLSDGRLTRCSFDSTGVGVFGRIEDFKTARTSAYELCRTCDQNVGVPLA